MSVDAASLDINDLNSAFKRVTSMAEAKGVAGVVPNIITKDDFDSLGEQQKKAAQQHKSDLNTESFTRLAYTTAALRDANYAAVGRKYMLALGLTKKCATLSARASLLARLN